MNQHTKEARYALIVNDRQEIIFKDAMPNLDFIHALDTKHISQALQGKLQQEYPDLFNSHGSGCASVFLLDYCLTKIQCLAPEIRAELRSVCEELMKATDLTHHSDLFLMPYPAYENNNHQLISAKGRYTTSQIKTNTEQYISQVSIYKKIDSLLGDYERILKKSDLDFSHKFVFDDASNYPKHQKDVSVSANQALDRTRINEMLLFSHITEPEHFSQFRVNPVHHNDDLTLRQLFAPSQEYWSLLFYDAESLIEHESINFVASLYSHKTAFTNSLVGAQKWDCLDMLSHKVEIFKTEKKQILAVQIQNNSFSKIHTFVPDSELHPQVMRFKNKLEASHLKNQLHQELDEQKTTPQRSPHNLDNLSHEGDHHENADLAMKPQKAKNKI